MKFTSVALQGATAKAPLDLKGQAGNITSNPWQKARRGKTFPKTKSIILPNTHYIRVVIPHEPALSTEKDFMDRSFNLLTTLHQHLEKLDESIVLHERNQWLENSPATARTITIPLSLKEANRNNHYTDDILNQFTEIYTEAKRGGRTTTYLRFCMTAKRNVPEMMQIITGEIRRNKSNVNVGISKTREIIDVVAGWLQGCDPIFLSAPVIETELRRALESKHGADKVPSFYVKKATETIWVNKQSEKSSAPVVKVICEASGTAILREMLNDCNQPEIFTKFVSNNNDKTVKWALLNDHIDELHSKRYLIIQGSAITISDNILEEEGMDNTQTTGTLRQLLKKQGMIPLLQQGQGGKALFAQIHCDKTEAVQVYLTTNFVEVKEMDWRIVEKQVKRVNMIKGVLATTVPTVLTTPNRSTSPHSGANAWSAASTRVGSLASTHVGSDAETVATLKINLETMSKKNVQLEKEKTALETEVEELKTFKNEFETFKQEQKDKEDAAIKAQKDRDASIESSLNTLRAQVESLTHDNTRLQEQTQKTGFFSGIMNNPFRAPILDQSLSTTLPSDDDLLDMPNGWQTRKGSSKHPRTSANGTPPRESPHSNINRYAGLSDHGDDDDDDDEVLETSAIVKDSDVSIVDANSDILNMSTTSKEEVNLSADMPVDGENE
jgi:hypothetical protein